MQDSKEITDNDSKSYYRCPNCRCRAILFTPKPSAPYRSSEKQGVYWRRNRWEAWLGRKYLGRYVRKKDAETARANAIALAEINKNYDLKT